MNTIYSYIDLYECKKTKSFLFNIRFTSKIVVIIITLPMITTIIGNFESVNSGIGYMFIVFKKNPRQRTTINQLKHTMVTN